MIILVKFPVIDCSHSDRYLRKRQSLTSVDISAVRKTRKASLNWPGLSLSIESGIAIVADSCENDMIDWVDRNFQLKETVV